MGGGPDEASVTHSGNIAAGPGDMQIYVPEQMHYHERPQVITGANFLHWVPIYPRAPLDITSDSDVEFHIPASSTEHIDWQHTQLKMIVSFAKKNMATGKPDPFLAFNRGTLGEGAAAVPEEWDGARYYSTVEADDAEYIIPLDDFINTMWHNISLEINDTPVYSSNNDQSYRSYLESRVFTDDKDMDKFTYERLFTRDEGKGDVANPYKSRNKGALKRWQRIRRRQKIELASRINIDFLKENNSFAINGLRYFLKLTPAPDKFRFQITPETLQNEFCMTIHKIWLDVAFMKISAPALAGIEAGLRTSPAIYPFVRSEFRILPLHEGIREIRIPEIFNRQVPSDLILAMVDRDHFSGKFDKNPFFFLRNNIEQVTFYLDSISIPFSEYKIEREEDPDNLQNEDRRGTDESLMTPLNMLHAVAGTFDHGFDYQNYRSGNFILALKTDPTVPSDYKYWGVPKTGNTTLYIQFHGHLESEQQLLILARYPALMKVSANRTVEIK